MVPERYAHEISSGLGYIPVWPPGRKVSIGHLVTLSGGDFQVGEQELGDLGETFTTTAGHLRHTSRGDVRVSLKGEGSPATITVSFTSEGSVLFDAKDCRIKHLVQLDALEQMILRDRDWNARCHVVTEVLEARGLLLLIARNKGASIDLQVDSLDLPSLASPGVKFGAEMGGGSVTKFQLPITEAWHTIGFKAFRYDPGWLSRLKFKQARAAAADAPDMSSFATVADLFTE